MSKLKATLKLLWIGLLLSSCGSVKQISSLPYKDRKQFDKDYFEAAKNKLLNNTERSITLFHKALKSHPNSHAAMYQLGGLYFQKKHIPEAEEWSLKAVETSEAYNHWYSGQLAQVYYTGGKYLESAEVFEQMISNENQNPEVYLQAVNQYLNANKVGKALYWLGEMDKAIGLTEQSATKKEYIYLTIGQKEEAVRALEELVKAYPNEAIYRGFLAETLIKTGNKARAIQELETLAAIDSSMGRTEQLLFQLYTEQGEHDKAYDHLKKAFRSTEVSIGDKLKYFTPYFLNSNINLLARDRAMELSDILLATHPQDEVPYVVKGDLYNAIDSNVLSREYFFKAVHKEGADFQTWNKLLSMDAKLQRPDLQLSDSKLAIERFPNIPGFYLSLAFAHYDLKSFGKAISACDDGLDIAVEVADRVELLACKAISYDELDDFEKSEEFFDAALESSPDNALIMNNYAYALAERGVKLQYALTLVNKAIGIQGKSPYNLDTKGWVLYKSERYNDAVPLLQEAILMDPNGYESYEHLAQVYLKLGDVDQAKQLMDKARSLGSTLELIIE